MHGEHHVLQSDLYTLMYVSCHNALAKHFDLTIRFAFVERQLQPVPLMSVSVGSAVETTDCTHVTLLITQ